MLKPEPAQVRVADRIRTIAVSPSPLDASVWLNTLMEAPELLALGESSGLEEAIAMSLRAEVVIFCPGDSLEAGVEWVRRLQSANPDARVVAVGVPRDDDVFLAYVEAGAWACVFRDESVEAVAGAIVDAAHGCARVPADMAPALIYRLFRLRQSTIDPNSAGRMLEALTPRERDVLDLVAEGLTNQEIAQSLTIEPGTVKNHVHSILDKLQAENRLQASAFRLAAESPLRTEAK